MATSLKRKSGSASPPGSPGGPRAPKRRKNDSAIPIHLRGMKSGNLPADDGVVLGGEEDGEDDPGATLADDQLALQKLWEDESKTLRGILTQNMTADQLERHYAFTNSAVNWHTVNKVLGPTLGVSLSQKVGQVFSGVAKIFVGEMVELARKVQSDRNATGPLAPEDLREAYRRYVEQSGKIGVALPHRGKRLFSR